MTANCRLSPAKPCQHRLSMRRALILRTLESPNLPADRVPPFVHGVSDIIKKHIEGSLHLCMLLLELLHHCWVILASPGLSQSEFTDGRLPHCAAMTLIAALALLDE